jgi:hypothetical protein
LNGIIDKGEVCDGSFMGCFNCLHVAKFWNCSSTPDSNNPSILNGRCTMKCSADASMPYMDDAQIAG